MKFNVAKRTVSSVGAISSKKVTISSNAKAFRLLFGQIYPDIKKAIVRELFTNAWDSQKGAGTLETPIDIHLPTKWEPYFSIRDYGTGMTPTVVDDVYSKVFESTKDMDNDQAGTFGMGSKTPWGYTDSFSITSYVDGIFWYYEMYIDENGQPNIDLKATGETTETNGLEVSVGVLDDDFEVFKQHAERFALGANTPININREKFLYKREILKEGDGWQLYKNDPEASNVTQIRMGPVLYSLNRSYIRSYAEYGDDTINQFEKPFVLDFPIGEFEVTGSREDIIYDKESVAKLLNKMRIAIAVFKAEAHEDIKNSSSYQEAYLKLKDYTDSGFRPDNPKYGALSIGDSYVNIGVNIQRNPWKKTRLERFDPTGRINLNHLYDPMVKMHYFILINDEEKISHQKSRIENFMLNVGKNGLFYSRSNSYASKQYTFYMVYYSEMNELRRLNVYLPKNVMFVELKNIDKKPKDPTARPTYRSKFLKYNYYKSVEIAYGTTEMDDDSYYVRATYSTLLAGENEICKAIKYFGIDLTSEQILVIGNSQRHLIKELNLVDLIQAYKDETVNHRYNRDTMIFNAIAGLRYRFDRNELLRNENYRNAYFPDFVYDQNLIEPNFDQTINPEVSSEFISLIAEMEEAVNHHIEENPLYKFIDTNVLIENVTEIEKLIGDLK